MYGTCGRVHIISHLNSKVLPHLRVALDGVDMTSLLPRIHQDLFDFIDHDPDELGGLLEFWYRSNSEALSAALTVQSGVSLIVNVSNFQYFESLAKKLFLVADTLVLRDTRKWTQEELGNR